MTVHRVCVVCGTLYTGLGTRCSQHARAAYARKLQNSAEWRRLSKAFISAHPICADCGGKATEAHHTQARAEGGPLITTDLLGLCKSCHSKRTAIESDAQGTRGGGWRT